MKTQLFRMIFTGLICGALAIPLSADQKERGMMARGTVPALDNVTYNNSWAVLVGINDYQDPGIADLSAPESDVKHVREALVKRGFPASNIIELKGEEATRRNIEKALNSTVRKQAGTDDCLFVFFAGHGITEGDGDREEGFLAPYDAEKDDIAFSGISMRSLRHIAERNPSKHVLIAVDACFSGFSLTRSVDNKEWNDYYMKLVTSKRAVQILAAGRRDQPVIEESGYGVFTKVLCDGLDGLADVNQDGMITFGELGTWMHPRVARSSEGRNR